jgi:hypothetical protein
VRDGKDYGWVAVVAIVIAIAVFWKPISATWANISGGSARKEKVAAGKVIFYDTERWEGKGSYKSCAMCHAADFTPDPAKAGKIKMPDYRPGNPYPLKGVRARYGGVMSGDDKLIEAINNCLGQPSRMYVGKVSAAAPFMADLVAYVKTL